MYFEAFELLYRDQQFQVRCIGIDKQFEKCTCSFFRSSVFNGHLCFSSLWVKSTSILPSMLLTEYRDKKKIQGQKKKKRNMFYFTNELPLNHPKFQFSEREKNKLQFVCFFTLVLCEQTDIVDHIHGCWCTRQNWGVVRHRARQAFPQLSLFSLFLSKKPHTFYFKSSIIINGSLLLMALQFQHCPSQLINPLCTVCCFDMLPVLTFIFLQSARDYRFNYKRKSGCCTSGNLNKH